MAKIVIHQVELLGVYTARITNGTKADDQRVAAARLLLPQPVGAFVR